MFGAFFVVQALLFLIHTFVMRPPHGDEGVIYIVDADPRTGVLGTSLIIYRDRDTTQAGSVSSTNDLHTYRGESR